MSVRWVPSSDSVNASDEPRYLTEEEIAYIVDQIPYPMVAGTKNAASQRIRVQGEIARELR